MANPDDLLPPGPAPTPTPAPGPRSDERRGVTCEFCECRLDTKGNVLERGESARRFLDLETKVTNLQLSLDTANGTITELRGQLEAATAKPARRAGVLDDL